MVLLIFCIEMERLMSHEPSTLALQQNMKKCVHSFIPAISIAPLQVLYYSEALPTTARKLYRSFTPKRTDNCRQRTCPRSLRDGQSGSRTHDPPVESNRLNQCAITSHICVGPRFFDGLLFTNYTNRYTCKFGKIYHL